MEHHYFLQTQPNTRGSSLLTLPGQNLTRRTPLTAGVIVKGVDRTRHAHPVGTVFCCTELKRCGGFYRTGSITPIVSPDGERIYTDLYSETYIKEYDEYLQRCKLM